MRSTKATRWLSGTLAALMLAQGMCLPIGAAGWNLNSLKNWNSSSSQTSQMTTLQAKTTNVELQNGTAVIPSDATEEEVKEILFDALVSNKEVLGENFDPQSLNWEYYCTGKHWTSATKENWGSIFGFTTGSSIAKYEYPALAANDDGSYQVRLKDTDTAVTLTKKAKLDSSITLNEGTFTVALPYDENAQVDYDALRESIFNTVVASTTPEGLAWNSAGIEIAYQAKNSWGTTDWVSLEGNDGITGVVGSAYPAISTGEQKIRISYAGDDSYSSISKETTVTITERPTANIEINENPTVQLTVDKDLNLNVDKLYQDMFTAIVKSSEPTLTLDDVEITYYALNYVVDPSVPGTTHEWMPLEGGTKNLLTYPAISAGTQKVHIYWPGSQQYAPTTIEATVTVKDREQVQFTLNDAPYEVGMKFTTDQGYDYAATAQAIYNAVVVSTEPAVSYDQVKVEYDASLTGIGNYKPLDGNVWGDVKKFGTGEWKIKISVADTQDYRGNSVVVNVTTTDNRIASAVVLKEGVSFTYNMDADTMKQAIFDNVIDWDNSTLPTKETLSLDNFVIEYYGENVLTDNINGGVKQWAPIEGGTVTLLNYPQMGAGENQQIRISYKGNADYRPSDNAEGTVTVNKAKVSVKVNSTNIYADEQLPDDFITTDPDDKFDIYTIYAGITSNVTTGIYLDLPDRYTNSAVLKILDPVVQAIYGKSFTQLMNDGVTVGELRELFSTQELLDLLHTLSIDTGTFGQILETINKLPGIMDSVRVAFGTPSRAGLYTVAAVTDNKNYETGVGIGFLLVKMRLTGNQLTWNQEIPNGKLTAEQVKTFDFGATISRNGDVTIDQSGVHYLYSGFTSSWRIYSSTTTPPTEPGRYVVTVCILGGNYMAAPITRSFQITK